MTPDILAIVIATMLQMAGLGFIALQMRKMNDKMTADDASIYVQGHRVEEIVREMREMLQKAVVTHFSVTGGVSALSAQSARQ